MGGGSGVALLIAISNKRRLGDTLPMGTQQIGLFRISKLATYVLAERLTGVADSGSCDEPA